MSGEPAEAGRRRMIMRTRVTALAAVIAFAMAVAAVAVLAGRGGDQELVKLPIGSSGPGSVEDAAASTARSSLAYPAFGNVEYRVEGRLPDLAMTAPAYRLGSSTIPAEVGRLAAALGVDGPVRVDEHAWVVQDGELELRVERAAGLPWYLGPSCQDTPAGSSNAVGASMCARSGVVMGGGPATTIEPACGDGTVGCAPAKSEPRPVDAPPPPPAGPSHPPTAGPSHPPTTVACPPDAGCVVAEPCPPGADCAFPAPHPLPPPEKPPRPAHLPSREEAERLARAAFTRLGMALDGFAVDDGWVTWEARVERRVDGLRVFGLGASLSLGAKGEVVRANGFLAQPERIGDYPLVGLEKGLERLRGKVGIGPRPLSVDDRKPFPPGAEPADLPLGAPEAGTAGAGRAGAIPTTVAVDTEPAIGDCSDPSVICERPPDVTIAPAPPEPAPEPQPVVRRVSGAHLALLQVDAVLVPVYVFELDGGEETFPVPAVTDEWLEQEAPAARATRD